MKLTSREQYSVMRKRNKIRLKDIAQQIDVTVSTLSMYENDLRNLSKEKEEQYQEIIMRSSKEGDEA